MVDLNASISEEDRQHLWYEFTKNLIDKRILFYGVKVDKFEVFSTFLSKSKCIGDFIMLVSCLLSGKLENYKIVWKWDLCGYKARPS